MKASASTRRLRAQSVSAALRDVFTRAVEKAIPAKPGELRRGDTLHDATARMWGIPVLKRPEVDPLDVERVKANRADRRRPRTGAAVRVHRAHYDPRTSPRGAYRGPAQPRGSKVAQVAARLDAVEASMANHPAGKAVA